MLQDNLLQNLKDIHLPPPVAMWPLAPGWYFLMLIGSICLLTFIYVIYRHWQKTQYKKTALSEIANLRHTLKHGDTSEAIATLSTIMRRAALARFPRRAVAGLYGESWLQFLDKTGNTEEFTKGPGRALIIAPYQRSTTAEIKQLLHLVKNWIKHNV